jgi:hypothetical protein
MRLMHVCGGEDADADAGSIQRNSNKMVCSNSGRAVSHLLDWRGKGNGNITFIPGLGKAASARDEDEALSNRIVAVHKRPTICAVLCCAVPLPRRASDSPLGA